MTRVLGKWRYIVPPCVLTFQLFKGVGDSSKNPGGFFCEVCDCLLKDSAAYTDHLNGKKRTF